MKQHLPLIIFNAIGLIFIIFLITFAQEYCIPLQGNVVWPGTWEPGRIPMASNQQWVLSASPLFVSNGNVGVDTKNPIFKFQVNGAISGTSLCIGSDCRTSWPGGDTYWKANGANIYNANSGNVGIGTTVPGAKLDVSSSIATTTNPDIGQIISIQNQSMPLSNGDTRILTFGSLDSSTAFIRSVGRNLAIIGGSVGIGTTNPSQKLDVNGNIATNDVYLRSVGKWASQLGGDTYWKADGTNIYNTNSGNVGIGTIVPNHKLTIASSASGGNVQANIYNPIAGTGQVAGIRFHTASGWNVMLRTNQNNAWLELTDANGNWVHRWVGGNYYVTGNVGIGTSAPSYKLDVRGGDIYSSGYIRGGTGLCIGSDCRTSWPSASPTYCYWNGKAYSPGAICYTRVGTCYCFNQGYFPSLDQWKCNSNGTWSRELHGFCMCTLPEKYCGY